MNASGLRTVAWVVFAGLVGPAAHAVNIELVTIGNPGNAPDFRYSTRGRGSVAYTYNIGKYEVTAGQYTEFLNAVAATDTYGLYDTRMELLTTSVTHGCNIKRTGSPGSYVYTVSPEWADQPVNYVYWDDAARFVNWLHNGQPTGEQNLSTTEDGSYYLNGRDYGTRTAHATYVLPTLNEFYKAAFYDPAKPGGPGYWNYPTRSNTVPSNILDPGGTNNANYRLDHPPYSFTVGYPHRTEVGAFAASPSAYGTFDQAGNVEELIDSGTPFRLVASVGGAFLSAPIGLMAASCDGNGGPTQAMYWAGFRIAHIPEPGSLTLILLSVLRLPIGRRKF